VSTSDGRARDKDRDAAIELVEAAGAAGKIVEADRAKRVEELRRAETLADIFLITGDLGRPHPAPVAAWPTPTVEYGPPPGSGGYPTVSEVTARSARLPKALLLIPVLAVFLVVIGVIGSVVALRGGSVDDVLTSTPVEEKAPAEVLTAEGYGDLLAAVEEQSGGTTAFDTVLYPGYAVVSLPVDRRSKRYRSWYWDGSSLTTSSQGTSTSPRFDLARIDAAVVVDLVDRVQGLVDDPTSWYAIVRAPDDDGAMIWAYASNEFSESSYLGARPDGTVTYDSTEHD
jgi:hypothetical protein